MGLLRQRGKGLLPRDLQRGPADGVQLRSDERTRRGYGGYLCERRAGGHGRAGRWHARTDHRALLDAGQGQQRGGGEPEQGRLSSHSLRAGGGADQHAGHPADGGRGVGRAAGSQDAVPAVRGVRQQRDFLLEDGVPARAPDVHVRRAAGGELPGDEASAGTLPVPDAGVRREQGGPHPVGHLQLRSSQQQ